MRCRLCRVHKGPNCFLKMFYFFNLFPRFLVSWQVNKTSLPSGPQYLEEWNVLNTSAINFFIKDYNSRKKSLWVSNFKSIIMYDFLEIKLNFFFYAV